MKLTTQATLDLVRDILKDQIAPLVKEDFAKDIVRRLQIILDIAARSIDDAAAIRIEENEAIRGILGDAAQVIDDVVLRERIAACAQAPAQGYRIHELDADSRILRRALVDAQATLEISSDPRQREINRKIWAMLTGFETRRAAVT